YLDFRHQDIPGEDEQAEAYADVLRRMAGRPVVMRTLDVGGDKVKVDTRTGEYLERAN
ncbi:MAG: hypothetical protein HY851_09270, partial [candidate division Zixibacteria bacterium]|nr:hypothetical protein [candidate division Zixibacteria bacterium]